MNITSSNLQSIAKNLKLDLETINELLTKYDINTVNRIAGFFAQCAHESGDFKFKKENLNYSASALNAVFPKYFKNAGVDSNIYARQPEKIANRVYANRMGNGDEASGDGWKFRGRGFIQLTGKNNYTKFAESIKKSIDETISYLETDAGALESALWFWKTNNINKYCDNDDIIGMTKRINGGTNGIEDRTERYIKYKNTLVA